MSLDGRGKHLLLCFLGLYWEYKLCVYHLNYFLSHRQDVLFKLCCVRNEITEMQERVTQGLLVASCRLSGWVQCFPPALEGIIPMLDNTEEWWLFKFTLRTVSWDNWGAFPPALWFLILSHRGREDMVRALSLAEITAAMWESKLDCL